MADDQNKRAVPIGGAERATPMDRARQIQEMQRALESEPMPVARPTVAKPPVAAAPPPIAAFEVQPLPKLEGTIRPTVAEQGVYARAQVDSAKLFGGEQIEVTGNPWKVISFATMLPAVFDPPKPLAEYEAKVPPNAAKADEGLLFQVSLTPKDGKEPTLRRVVLTAPGGELRGVESKNANELRSLLGRATGLAGAVFGAAFGSGEASAATPRLADVTAGKRGGYNVTVVRGAEVRNVPVNNFGQPLSGDVSARAHIDVASYMLDKFEAA